MHSHAQRGNEGTIPSIVFFMSSQRGNEGKGVASPYLVRIVSLKATHKLFVSPQDMLEYYHSL